MKKVTLIFIVLNIVLLLFWYFFIKNNSFSRIDDFIYSKVLSIWADNYSIKGEDKTILLKIDKKFFDKMWVTTSTFHRWYYSKLLKKLQSYWVENIVFDVYFWNLKYWTWDGKVQKIYNTSLQVFDNQFENQIDEKVILWAIPNWTGIIMPADKFLKNNNWVGHVKSHTNNSDINNWVYPYLNENKNQILTLWYAAYLNKLYLNWKISENFNIKKIESKNIFKPSILNIKTSNEKYNFKIPLSKDSNNQKYIFTPMLKTSDSIKSYSIYDIINDEDNIYESIFKWKNIFIGATDETLNDIKLSYIGIIPWVIFHINQFLSMYDNRYIYIAPIMVTFSILVFIFIISYIFITAFKDEKLSIITFTTIAFFLFSSFYYLFVSFWILIPVWTILIILSIKLFIDISHILFINQDRKEFVTNLFNKYIWDKVLEKKWEKSWEHKVAEKKDIALMFSDIAWFTDISEQLTAQEVIDMLNIYFEKTNTSIVRSKWFIDKYVWDAIMAFWEDIDKLDNTIHAIIQIQKIHPKIIKDVEQKLWKKINIFTRIWLHYWQAVVWDVWDNKSKISYTAIWDNVNLAARLEWINKYYWTSIIISEAFYKKIEKKEEYAIRLVDKITVKWKTKPIKIYQVIPYYTNEITHELISYIEEFENMLEFYFNWEFIKSQKIIEKLLILSIWKEDKVLSIYKNRINTLIETPPNSWDGIWRFTTK